MRPVDQDGAGGARPWEVWSGGSSMSAVAPHRRAHLCKGHGVLPTSTPTKVRQHRPAPFSFPERHKARFCAISSPPAPSPVTAFSVSPTTSTSSIPLMRLQHHFTVSPSTSQTLLPCPRSSAPTPGMDALPTASGRHLVLRPCSQHTKRPARHSEKSGGCRLFTDDHEGP